MYPIELINLTDSRVDQLVEFGSSSGSKIQKITNEIIDYGPYIYNLTPFIHQFMVSIDVIARLNNKNFFTDLEIPKMYLKKIIAIVNKPFSEKVQFTDIKDRYTSFLFLNANNVETSYYKVEDTVGIYINSDKKIFEKIKYLELQPTIIKKEGCEPYHKPKNLKSIMIVSESQALLSLLSHFDYTIDLFYTDEKIIWNNVLHESNNM